MVVKACLPEKELQCNIGVYLPQYLLDINISTFVMTVENVTGMDLICNVFLVAK
jgi:hypothetical protein